MTLDSDALDNLNNKLAIQLADKILKKQKDLHCAKALKALALLRSNRLPECLELQEELKRINVWDDSILQCMTMTYKEMQKREYAKQHHPIYRLYFYPRAINLCKCNSFSVQFYLYTTDEEYYSNTVLIYT